MIRALLLMVSAAALLGAGIVVGLQLRTEDVPATKQAKPSPTLKPQYRSGPFQVAVTVTPQIPKIGDNRVRVAVFDQHGGPVSGATLKAVAEMPAMGSMPAMQAPADLKETEPGLYLGTFKLPMKGSWPLSVAITKPEVGKTRLTLDMATGRAGLELSSGGTPVNATQNKRASGSAENATLPYRSGPYRLDVNVEPQTPRVGKNTLTIVLHQDNGEPVTGATIRAVAEMPAMGTMPAMQAPAEMKATKPGVYRGTFDLPMEGSWPVSLSIQAPDLPERHVSFDLATGRKGLQLASGASNADRGGAETVEEAPPGTVTLDSSRRQLIGVKTGKAEKTDLQRTIRAVGHVTYDETRLADVSLKFDAWIGELTADYVGAPVKKRQRLFTVYGPELFSAQQEYLELRRRTRRSSGSDSLLEAARKRLSLWDMTAADLKALEQRGRPFEYVPIRAPQDGTVIMKNIVEGSARKAGMPLMRIADLSRVWVEADVYESELPLVHVGMPVTVRLPYLPGKPFPGTVDYLYPYLQTQSRTGRIRIVLDNPDGVLKPDMYAQVTLAAHLGQRLTVPEEAVIVSGDTRVVFEDIGGGRLAPRKVTTGQRAGGRIEILSGLDPGDRVVTSGNFLIASESRLKAGIEQW